MFFPTSVSSGSSAVVKVPEQVGAAKSHCARFPSKVPRKRVPKQGSQKQVPKQGSQEEVPNQGSQEEVRKQGFQEVRFPERGSQEQVPKQGSQEEVPKVPRKRLLSKVSGKMLPNIPKQGSQAKFLIKVPKFSRNKFQKFLKVSK